MDTNQKTNERLNVMDQIDRLRKRGFKKIPFQYFVEMYSGNAQFEHAEKNRYRIVSSRQNRMPRPEL
jgi:hypothetical protein